MMEKVQYAVTFTYNFDEDAATYLFDDFDKAKNFLVDSMKKEYEIDKHENGWDTNIFISESNCYAKITNYFHDHNDITEAHLSNIYN